MEDPLLLELKGQDQLDKVLSSLQEIVESGTSVVFSFSRSGGVTVLLANPTSGARITEPCLVDQNINQKRIRQSRKQEIVSGAEKRTVHNSGEHGKDYPD
jgi:hypothetical protein